MTRALSTGRRLRLLEPVLKAFPGLGYRSARELRALIHAELGHAEALDRPVRHVGQYARAIAPGTIYHVTAGNLAVSAWQSLLWGLVLGSRNIVKPALDGMDDVRRFVRALPSELRSLVAVRNRFSPGEMRRADAVVVYGRDETIRELRRQAGPGQIFLGYGHRLGFLWLRRPDRNMRELARTCAYDVAVYDQSGCLSPHAIFLPPGKNTVVFAGLLARELQRWCEWLPPVSRSPATAARVREARDLAAARGAAVWESEGSTAWTVILEKTARFQPSCLSRTIYLHPAASLAGVARSLRELGGKISTAGVGAAPTPEERRILEGMGVSRICPAGRMQHPAPGWHHDGRPNLADLVRWTDVEPF